MAAELDAAPAGVRHRQHVAAADEARDELGIRVLVHILRRADLLDAAGIHDDDAIGHRHRLDLVVRHVDRRVLELVVQAADLEAHAAAQVGIEVRQRLVEQQDVRLRGKRAGEGDALLLPAGELRRIAFSPAR